MKLTARRIFLPLALVAGLGACSQATLDSDPLEGPNRAVHAFNKGLDRTVIGPASRAYGTAVPGPLRRGISNGVSNLREPLNFVNHTLQGDVQGAGGAVTRFGMNTLFGFGGLLDIASEAGVPENDTDFGETLAVWGVPSGAYVELPFLGPSTVRDGFGTAVDFAINPVNTAVDGDAAYALAGARAADLLQTRHEFARIIETLLYDSADSYAAARIAYLQNRARSIQSEIATEDLEDPFAFE